jgi:hypothetical protein
MRYKNVTPSSTYNRKQYVFTLKFQLPLISLISGYVLSVAKQQSGYQRLKNEENSAEGKKKITSHGM